MAKRDAKQQGQKGKPNSDTTNPVMAAEEMTKATHPTKRQNSKQ